MWIVWGATLIWSPTSTHPFVLTSSLYQVTSTISLSGQAVTKLIIQAAIHMCIQVRFSYLSTPWARPSTTYRWIQPLFLLMGSAQTSQSAFRARLIWIRPEISLFMRAVMTPYRFTSTRWMLTLIQYTSALGWALTIVMRAFRWTLFMGLLIL